MGFTEADDYLCHTIRVVSKRPVALLCTSGEASSFVIFKVGFGEENPYPSIL